MSTVTVTFVKETFVLVTFVHIRKISAVTDPILTKLCEPKFFAPGNYLDPKFCWTSFFWTHNFLDPKYRDLFFLTWFFWLLIFEPKFLRNKIFWNWKFSLPKLFWTWNFFGLNILLTKIFLDSISFTQNLPKIMFCINDFWSKKVLGQNFFGRTLLLNQQIFGPKFFLKQNFFDHKFCCTKYLIA